jgi:hypothetical protein
MMTKIKMAIVIAAALGVAVTVAVARTGSNSGPVSGSSGVANTSPHTPNPNVARIPSGQTTQGTKAGKTCGNKNCQPTCTGWAILPVILQEHCIRY